MMKIKFNRMKSSRPTVKPVTSGMDDKVVQNMGGNNEKYDSGFLSETLETWNKINLEKASKNKKAY